MTKCSISDNTVVPPLETKRAARVPPTGDGGVDGSACIRELDFAGALFRFTASTN